MIETNQAGSRGTSAYGTETGAGGGVLVSGMIRSANAALDAMNEAIADGDYVKAGMMEHMRNEALSRAGSDFGHTDYFGSYEDVTTLTNEELGNIYKDRKRFEKTGKHEYPFDIAQLYRARHGYAADKDGNAVPFDPDADYSEWIERAESLSDDKAAAGFEKIRNAKIETLGLDEEKTGRYAVSPEVAVTVESEKQAAEKDDRAAAYRRLEDSMDKGLLDVSAYGEPGLGGVIDGIVDKIRDFAEGVRDFFAPDEEDMEKARELQRQAGTGGLAKGNGTFATPDWRSFNGAPDGAKADGVSEGKPRYAGADVSGIKSRDSGKDLQVE